MSEASFGSYFIRNADRGASTDPAKSRTFDSPLRRLAPIDRSAPGAGGGGDRASGFVPAGEASANRFKDLETVNGPARYGRGAYRHQGSADLPLSPLVRGGIAAGGRSRAEAGGTRPGGAAARATPTIEAAGSGFARGHVREGAESPRDPRVYYFGFYSAYPSGWSFYFNFCRPLPAFSFAWSCGYDPFFTCYTWYPYFCHGGIYYYYDFPYYCSPANSYYEYDVSYPETSVVAEPDEPDAAWTSFGERSLASGPRESPETITDYFLRLGDGFFRAGEYEKAVDAFRKAVDSDPSAPVAFFALGEALFAVGEYSYAAYAIRKGFDLDPGWVENPIDRREFYGQVSDFRNQMRALEAHCAASPYDAAGLLVLAYNRYFTGEEAPAREAFSALLELYGSDRLAEAFLDRLAREGTPTRPFVEKD